MKCWIITPHSPSVRCSWKESRIPWDGTTVKDKAAVPTTVIGKQPYWGAVSNHSAHDQNHSNTSNWDQGGFSVSIQFLPLIIESFSLFPLSNEVTTHASSLPGNFIAAHQSLPCSVFAYYLSPENCGSISSIHPLHQQIWFPQSSRRRPLLPSSPTHRSSRSTERENLHPPHQWGSHNLLKELLHRVLIIRFGERFIGNRTIRDFA